MVVNSNSKLEEITIMETLTRTITIIKMLEKQQVEGRTRSNNIHTRRHCSLPLIKACT